MALLIRDARLSDVQAVADVQVRGFRAGYADFFPLDYLNSLSVDYAAGLWQERLADPQHKLLVATLDEVVVGYAWYYLGDADGSGCLLSQLYVVPEVWSQGVGSALLLAAERDLSAEGFSRVTLWVYELNARAQPFYEKRGWSFDGATDLVDRGGAQLVLLRYSKSLAPEATA